MKKLFPVILLIAGLTATHATAQTFMPAKQVTVVTTNWTTLSPSTNTAQSVFDYIDTEGVGGGTNVIGSGGYGTNTFVNPATWQQILQTPSVSTSGVVAGGFYLPGTNIVGATYDETNDQWTVDTQTNNFLPGTNIVGATYDETNEQWTVDTQTNNFLPGTNILSFSYTNNTWFPSEEYNFEVFSAYKNVARNSGAVNTVYPVTSYTTVKGTNYFSFDNSTGVLSLPLSGIYAFSSDIGGAVAGQNSRVELRTQVSKNSGSSWSTIGFSRLQRPDAGAGTFWGHATSFSAVYLSTNDLVRFAHVATLNNGFSSTNQALLTSVQAVYLRPGPEESFIEPGGVTPP